MRNILLAFALLLSSCENDVRDPKGLTITTSNWTGEHERNLSVVTVDGCEYLTYELGTNFGVMTHKGNCKSEFHKTQTK